MDEPIAELDNPAGRLYMHLSEFRRHSHNQSIAGAWQQALGASTEELPLRLAGVAQLVDEVRQRVRAEPSNAYAALDDLLLALANTAFAPRNSIDDPAHVVEPDGTAMVLLRAYSHHLHNHASEGLLPGQEDLEALRLELQELIVLVVASELPPEFKRLLNQRLSELLAALENADLTGVNGVQRACEALVAIAVIGGAEVEDQATVERIKKFAKHAWNVIYVAASLGGGVNGWNTLMNGEPPQLPPANQPPQLPPGP